MKDTIKATYGYRVVKARNTDTGDEVYIICDGCYKLFIAHKRSYDDYKDEERNNEMFMFCEVFTTIKGNQFIYWRDDEIDADYITNVKKK